MDIINLSKFNAKALWNWKGEVEWNGTKEEIKRAKKNLQSLANKACTKKGDTLKQLEAINILSGELILHIKYLKEIKSIKEISEL